MVKICAFFSCKSRRCQKSEKTREIDNLATCWLSMIWFGSESNSVFQQLKNTETDDRRTYKMLSIVSTFLPFILSFIFCNFFCIRIHTDDWYKYHTHTLNEWYSAWILVLNIPKRANMIVLCFIFILGYILE